MHFEVVLLVLLLVQLVLSFEEFELDKRLPTVTCRQCIQLWRSVARDSRSVCSPNSPTCSGNVCFMRQCKNCPSYQYISGCLSLTEWQIAELSISKQRGELQATRIGAALLCEDNINQTTCLCNRRDKCNDIHARTPFTTYTGQLFNGIINFNVAIARIDPRYSDSVLGRQHHFGYHFINGTNRMRPSSLFAQYLFSLFCGLAVYFAVFSIE